MIEFTPTAETRITYDPEVGAVYIKPHCDKIFPAILPRTVVLSESPFIAVDILSDAVVGIEIFLQRNE